MIQVKNPFMMLLISRNDPFRYRATLEQRRKHVTFMAIGTDKSQNY